MELCQPAFRATNVAKGFGRVLKAGLYLSPVLFVASAGLIARLGHTDYVVRANSSIQDANLLAYASYVAKADRAVRSNSSVETRAAAERWLGGFRSGELHPIQASSFEDIPRYGVKGQVLRSQHALVNALLKDEGIATSPAAIEQQARDALLAVQLASTMKLSDLRTSHVAANRQRRALEVLDALAPAMNPSLRHEVLAGLPSVQANHAAMEKLTVDSRQHYYDFVRRNGDEPLTIEDVRMTVGFTERAANADNGAVAVRASSGYLLANAEVDMAFLTDLRLAWTQNRMFENELEALCKKLGSLTVR